MMKKLLALALVVFGLAACQTEPQFDVNVGGEQEVMLTVSLPEATRASSAQGFDLSTLSTTNSGYTLRYILEVYRFEVGENDSITVLTDHCQHFVKAADATSMVFPVRLAPGYNYRIVAWADIVLDNGEMKDRCYNALNGLAHISIVEDMWKPMDESRDAFTGVKDITNFNSSSNLDMTLTRPFAKLRVVATDIEDIRAVSLKPTKATVGYYDSMPRSYDAINGIATGQDRKTHEFSYPATPAYEDATGEYTLFADYIFVPADGTAQFSLDVYADDAKQMLIKNNAFNTEICVERNKLTTIKGDVLTIGGDIEVTIENNGAFGGENEYPVLDRTEPANNEIWYIPYGNNVVEPNNDRAFNVKIVSNTYANGLGIIQFEGPLTQINKDAFFFKQMKEIVLPDGLESIGESAFLGSQLTGVITIPDSVESIGEGAFSECYFTAFSGKGACDEGKCLIFGDELLAFANRCGATSYAIPDGIKTIKFGAFAYSTIESIDLDNGALATIDMSAFYGCKNLTSVTIPTSVTSIGKCAFTGCDSLENVYIFAQIPPAGYDDMFSGCSDNLKIYIPVGSLEAYQTAEGWSNYTDKFVVCPPSNEIWYTSTDGNIVEPSNADAFGATIVSNDYDNNKGCWVIKFEGNVTKIGNDAFWGKNKLESIIMPNSITEISQGAFVQCDGLTSFVIPDSVLKLDRSIFAHCDNLTTVIIGDSVTEIGSEVFYGCSSLQTITIGTSVTKIWQMIVDECNSLSVINCKATTPPVLNSGTFNQLPDAAKIYVPAEAYYDYILAYGWKDYANQIVAYDFESNCEVTPIVSVNEILYTSTADQPAITPTADAFNATISSHTFVNGMGRIKFDGDVTTIGDYAFNECSHLTKIIIPHTVTNISGSAFKDCTSLCEMDLRATTPPTIGLDIFYWCSNIIRVYVPAESLEDYKTDDYWRSLSTVIFAR